MTWWSKFRRLFRWERDSVPPSERDEGEITGVYNQALLDLKRTTESMSSQHPRSPSLADAERAVQDGIKEASGVFDDVLGRPKR